MARYRKIDVRMWGDGKFRKLSAPEPNAQTLWLYLLTGPQTTSIPGIFSAGEAGTAESLDWPIDGFRRAFREVEAAGMVKASWRDRLVWVPNAIRYNPPESPNVIRSWRAAWDELPECPLKVEAFFALKAFLEALGEAFGKAFREAFGEGYVRVTDGALKDPSANQEQEQEQENPYAGSGEKNPEPLELVAQEPEAPGPVQEVFEHWKRAMGHPGAKLDKKRRGRIQDRLSDGYSVEDLKAAVDGCAMTPHNMGQNENGTRYDDIELICRDVVRVERFIGKARGKVLPGKGADPPTQAAPLVPRARAAGGGHAG